MKEENIETKECLDEVTESGAELVEPMSVISVSEVETTETSTIQHEREESDASATSEPTNDNHDGETPSSHKSTRNSNKCKLKKTCRSCIGGQAVIEGVMMRGERSMATCVREPNGNMAVESVRLKPLKEKNIVFRIPFIRGVFNFFSSMVGGMKTLMRSASVYAGEEEVSNTEKWIAKKFKVDIMDVVMTISVILGMLLSIGLFFFLPLLITEGFRALDTDKYMHPIFWNFLDGAIRMIIFIIYIALTTLIPDVKRTFMYHGAEHKTISCYEHGLELNVENAQKMSTIHDRCGTTFMFLVMVISILVFSLTGWEGDNSVGGFFLRFVIRLALLPVVAGVSYEILKFLARFDNTFVRIIKWPGLLLQKLTTKQPTDDMVECAICAFKTVMAMDADESIAETKFDVKLLYKKSREELLRELGSDDEESNARLDWVLVDVLGVERSALGELTHIRQSEYDRALAMVRELKAGRPLQHVLGNTEFYGYTMKTDSRALVPRMDTEWVVDAVDKAVKAHGYKSGLDMCTGTGVIAIVLIRENLAIEHMVAVDVSKYALELARENVELNECDNIELVESDLFENIEGKFDFIVSNPPYIKRGDIATLDSEVKDYEPMLALDGGEDGLDYYRAIIEQAPRYLNEGGMLAFEIGIGEMEDVRDMMSEHFRDIEVAQDLSGIDRTVIGYLK